MRLLPVAVTLVAFAGLLSAESVDSVLARMDKAAPSFHALSADLTMDNYTAILQDDAKDQGSLVMQRWKNNETRAIIKLTGSQRTVAVLGKVIEIYYPNLKTYNKVDIGDKSQMINTFMLLGFGSSGKDLAAAYTITAEGQEDVNGKPTTKLLLVPKDPAVQKELAKAELWIPEDAPYPLQQQFYKPANGNWSKITYANIVVNPPIQGQLDFKIPAGTKKEKQ